MTETDAGNNDDPLAIAASTRLKFQITDTKLYVPIVTLSTKNDKKLFEQLKPGFKRTVQWNKYRSQMAIRNNNNNLNSLINPTFTKVNRLFVLSIARITGENNTAKDRKDSFYHYYAPNVEIKDFHVLIDRKDFFDFPVKNKEESFGKIIKWIKIITIQLVIYWILLISKKTTD